MQLVPMRKGLDFIEVHPSTESAHQSFGWIRCEAQDQVQSDKKNSEVAWANTPDGEYVNLGDMSKEQLQALAKKHSVEVHHKSGVDKLIEALQSAFAKKD